MDQKKCLVRYLKQKENERRRKMKTLKNLLLTAGIFAETLAGSLGIVGNVKEQELEYTRIGKPYIKDTAFALPNDTFSSEHAFVIFKYEKDTAIAKKTLDMFEKFGVFSKTKKQKILLDNKEKYIWTVNNGTIYGSSKSFSDSTVKYTLFHENAHIYLEEQLKEVSQEMRKLHLRVSGGWEYKPNLMRETAEEANSRLKKPETPGLSNLFTESTYIKWRALEKGICIKSDVGHAGSNPDELFASASTILYFFPKDFFEFLDIIKKDSVKHPGYAQLAKEVARKVVSIYGENRIFSDEVYEKLNLNNKSKE